MKEGKPASSWGWIIATLGYMVLITFALLSGAVDKIFLAIGQSDARFVVLFVALAPIVFGVAMAYSAAQSTASESVREDVKNGDFFVGGLVAFAVLVVVLSLAK
jgi:hypothetical protein